MIDSRKRVKKILKRELNKIRFFETFYENIDPILRYAIENEGETVYLSLANELGYEVSKRQPYILGSESGIEFKIYPTTVAGFFLWKKKKSRRPKFERALTAEKFLKKGTYTLLLELEFIIEGKKLFPTGDPVTLSDV